MPRQPPKPKTDPQEVDFLKAYDPASFDRPSVTADLVLLTVLEDALHALMIRRSEHPFLGAWSLPGGFVHMDESLEVAASRVLREKAGLSRIFLEQLYTFGEPTRDPRTRIISVAYMALVDSDRLLKAQSHGHDVQLARVDVSWAGEEGGPAKLIGPDGKKLSLAFDHADIVGLAVKRLRGKLDYTPVGFQLLPATFTLFQLQRVHEVILGHPLNKDSFRRRMLASGQLKPTGHAQEDVGHRPAGLYRFAGPST